MIFRLPAKYLPGYFDGAILLVKLSYVKSFFLLWWQYVGLCGIKALGFKLYAWDVSAVVTIIRISLSCVIGYGHVPSLWLWTKVTFLSFQSLSGCVCFLSRAKIVMF